jgi:hypothetical protein
MFKDQIFIVILIKNINLHYFTKNESFDKKWQFFSTFCKYDDDNVFISTFCEVNDDDMKNINNLPALRRQHKHRSRMSAILCVSCKIISQKNICKYPLSGTIYCNFFC